MSVAWYLLPSLGDGVLNDDALTHSTVWVFVLLTLQWRHNGRDGVSSHQPHDCLLNRLFRRRSKKTSMFRVTGLCAGNSPVIGEFPAHMASNVENVSIWLRYLIDVIEYGWLQISKVWQT